MINVVVPEKFNQHIESYPLWVAFFLREFQDFRSFGSILYLEKSDFFIYSPLITMEQPTIQSQTQEMPSLERTLLEMLQTEKAEAEELLKKTQKEIQKKAEAIQLEKERSFDAHLSELKKLPPKEYLNALKKLFPTSKDIKERRRYL